MNENPLAVDLRAVGARLKEAREARGWTQQDAADRLGVARTTMVAIEKGERRLKPGELIELAGLYGRPVADVLQRGAPAEGFAVQLRGVLPASPIDADLLPYLEEFQSLCDAGQSASARFNLYIDRRWRLGQNWVAKIGVARYDSPGNAYRALVRYDEINAAVGWKGRWRASLAVSPDVAGHWDRVYRHGPAAWLELDYHQPLVGRLAFDLGAGHAWLQETGFDDYRYGSAGLAYGIGDLHLYAAWQWNDREALPYGAMSQAWYPAQDPSEWVVSALWVF